MKSKNTALRRLAAGAGAFALALAGFVGAGAAAQAAQGQDGIAPGNADEGTTGTLIVTKFAGSATGDINKGTEQVIDRQPLGGVTFGVCKVAGIDLKTSDGWTAAEDVTTTNATCDTSFAAVSETTTADGKATFAGLPIGLYLVEETAVPTGVTPLADKFLVSIPYPSKSGEDPATSNWLWTVNVYPKNTLAGDGEKTVADPAAHGLGEMVQWTLNSRPLGSFNDGAALTTYVLIDQLNDNLRYEKTASLEYTSPGGSETTVDANHYTLAPVAPATDGGGTVTATFTETGLAWIKTLPAGTYFTWKLDTEVVGVGVLDNKFLENTGGENVDIDSATTAWGAAKLLKHDSDTNDGLVGAKFEVHNVNEDGTCTPVGTKVTVGGATEFMSDAHGVVDIPGLYVGKDGVPTSRDYCVVETVAPAGYTLNATPHKITVTPGVVGDLEWSAKIPNVPAEGPDLPLTGAQGTMLMTVGGLLLVGTGGSALAIARRRNKA